MLGFQVPCLYPVLLLVLFSLCLQAQGPLLHADGSVTFRLVAPQAKEVVLQREGAAPAPLRRAADGGWFLTTKPLSPGLHPYSFLVDGEPWRDPANPKCKSMILGPGESLIHVPGLTAPAWDAEKRRQDALHHHRYASARFGETRDVWVYTPPGYDPARIYPVLILLHGVMEDAEAWITAGEADRILDHLILHDEAEPMIAVFPLGYGFSDPSSHVLQLFSAGPDRQRAFMDAFGSSLFDELLPFLEGHYRMRHDRDGRALAGASMGGAQALYLGLTHAERFGWIGAFSGAYVLLGSSWGQTLPREMSPKPHLLWMACGTEDLLLPAHREMAARLRGLGLPVLAEEAPGDHTFSAWERHLLAFAPRLFPTTTP